MIFTRSVAALSLCGVSAQAAHEITREDYQELKRELTELRQEVKSLRSSPAPTRAAGKKSLSQSMTDMADGGDSAASGESKFVLAGGAQATFNSTRNSASNFSAVFEPMFLYRINDHLLFEAELEFELEGSSTLTKLEFAHLDWELNDNLTLIAGKFLNPVNTYVERYAPTWIRKLPDSPIGLYDGFLPESNVGLQLRGVYPVGEHRLNFAAYVSNAPRLITDDPEALGSLDFDNWESQGDGKAYGGRVGFVFATNFEIGYGAQYARVRGDGTRSTSSLLQSVDLSGHVDAAMGRFALQSQYSWSKTGDFTYDADSSLGVGPTRFDNKRSGGYVQLSYRGRQWESALMNRLEFIVRGDMAKAPYDAPGGFDEKRLTLGVDYWIAPATVLKTAYEIDNRNNNEPNADAIVVQLSTGF